MIHHISTAFLLDISDPFRNDPWGCGPITPEMVSKAEPNSDAWDPDNDEQVWTAEQHAGRVKWLMQQETFHPIQIDVGVPTLGYHARAILDGHHRLCAGVCRNDEYLPCEVQGQVSVVESFLKP